MQETNPNTWRYKVVKGYLRLINETLVVRHRYTIGMENLPKKGEKFFIVCNHQNTANDPLNIVFTLPLSWHVCALARANVFSVNALFTRFLNWIGLIPAFRFGWEGGEGLENNFESFDIIAKRVNHPYPFLVFPEAGHTQGHYLGRFTTGTTRMAFHAAQANGWQDDIKIVPTAHHYADYFELNADFLWMIGKPISLKPYYEAYQAHPNSVMREITHQLRDSVESMMLDEGIEDYEAKDFLRCSALNQAAVDDLPLPERLEADKSFVSRLRNHPHYQEVIQLATRLKAQEDDLKIKDILFAKKPGWAKVLCSTVVLLCLLPLWIFSLWPHAICYAFPPRLIKNDKMFTNSYRYVMSALFLYPLFALLTLAVLGIGWGWWWQALAWILLWIPIGRFSWWYYQTLRHTSQAFRFLTSSTKIREIEQLRNNIKNILKYE